MPDGDHTASSPPQGSRKRTRTGCLNCRRKRRKCDERKPTCEGCLSRRERCQYGVRVSFRPENAHTMGRDHDSMRQGVAAQRPQAFQIVDVTQEVIRDYFEETTNGEPHDLRNGDVPVPKPPPSLPIDVSPSLSVEHALHGVETHRLSSASTISPDPATLGLQFPTAPELFVSPQDSTFEDGIFLPGSQYQELHAALRSRIIDTARSTVPSRVASPEISEDAPVAPSFESLASPIDDDDESRRLAHLTAEQEYTLWQNYINEVASWLDKFDNDRHFELVLPILAKSHPHLKYSLLALSARQMERLEHNADSSCSLALYQHAVHLLSPLLHLRTTVVLASCIVLCVLEMLSCSPKAWRRHLDGCAALIQALGISGSHGGSLAQALFWIFARMDICGALISSEKTLIPIARWLGGPDAAADIALLGSARRFDMYANHVVYLCGRVVDLLCSSGRWEQRASRTHSAALDVLDYSDSWMQLFELVEAWYHGRPEEMMPLLTIPVRRSGIVAVDGGSGGGVGGADAHDGAVSAAAAVAARPFPTLLFANGPAVSGNQMYHTAALLMLRHRPAHARPARKPHSILWHARQICAISLSNDHHGCWTNSIQPLWIAGQHMSHPCEHAAILELLRHIERETGWSTKWRQDDLRDFWGSLDE